jgi:hypothetical protein
VRFAWVPGGSAEGNCPLPGIAGRQTSGVPELLLFLFSPPAAAEKDDLDLRLSAIDEQFNSIDKAALIRCEENGGFRNFVRIAQPP